MSPNNRAAASVTFTCVMVFSSLGLAAPLKPDPVQILKRVDDAANQARDAQMTLNLSITRGDSSVRRTIRVWQRGADRRLVKFVAPARLRGTGILVLDDDTTYLYLPAYKRVRRISGREGNGSWMGTGFSINDLSRVRFSKDYRPKFVSETESTWTLRLDPIRAEDHKHAYLTIEVRKADDLVSLITSWRDTKTRLRTITASEFRKSGKYTVAHKVEIHELEKKRVTRASLTEISFDTGLSEDTFSVTWLRRAP